MMDEPEVYIIQPDAMDTNMCKNYVRDRMTAALIYISEYAETQKILAANIENILKTHGEEREKVGE